MPLVRRKKVLLHDIPDTIAAEPAQSTREVFFIERTGEIFMDYESYSARMLFYRMKIFQCELTGKGGLDYFQALESERNEALTIHSRFPEQLKPPVLSAVQFQIMGRLDHLVELVYERFVHRYFRGEKVFVDIQNEKYYARIIKVFPPKTLINGTSPSKDAPPIVPHSVGVNLRVSYEESVEKDDPMGYFYAVRMIEETDASTGDGGGEADDDPESEKWAGSEMEVKANAMSRDRLSFSKSILRRFIRDCVDRDPAVASPWTVKRAIAEKHGVPTEMTEDIRMAINGAKQGEKEKRKKVWEEKHEIEGIPASKRRKKEEKDTATPSGAPAEKPKPKGPIKYPIEDLDVTISERERKAGKAVVRPAFDRDVPFGSDFEPFLMSWAFMQSFGAVLKLSTFTLDEYEMAVRHNLPDVQCALITEIHLCLLTVAKERSPIKFIALDSLNFYDSQDREGEVPFADLTKAAKSVGDRRASGWETPIGRESKSGWEEGLTIFIRDHATIDNLPNLRRILRSLLFVPETDPISSSPSDVTPATFARVQPSERYPFLFAEDKIAIIGLLVEMCLFSRVIRGHIDWADTSLTELRKEKIEVNREKKRLMEEITTIDAKIEPGAGTPAPPETNGVKESPAPQSSDVESEQRANDDRSDITDEQPTGRRSRASLARKASAKLQASQTPASKVAGHGKERAQARIKAQEMKNALAERRKLEDELTKVERRLEAIEREFRQLFGVGRTRPLGKDRFFNRVWWLDGMGSGTLVASGGQATYGTGRVFIQGPTEADLPILRDRGDSFIRKRHEEEDGPDGTLKTGTWAYYSEPHQVEEFIGWLNPKGHRELALKNQLLKWSDHTTSGMRKRTSDISSRPERRSTRGRNTAAAGTSDVSRELYMTWTNRLSSTNLAK
ncbi:ATP-utilizing chromatin assembly and remodelling N-terminal-domain-containing protein [Cantharellus anzutake]|uniref:ATP-utilizing chromatin assembly and remodelling N-terminal-domain-containing protein n=1 Tax=Cantharellus anzutake TaxID=1750568 RepID=UPI00190634B8|nr:ATP-utilizing chromatin assembly and remodelling N-terminal-domain-containing protein [Cantharellus anzutake]KAF8342653.1 ATP-utilizing chromatin assembly and remodelling N-terminal-domain-containing protein [Cantharellus anzutake]